MSPVAFFLKTAENRNRMNREDRYQKDRTPDSRQSMYGYILNFSGPSRGEPLMASSEFSAENETRGNTPVMII